MTKPVGRWVPLSPYRQLVTDLMHFSRQTPAITSDRCMNLTALVAARQWASERPTWAVLFAKAYGMLCRDHPVLRRSFLRSPWPHLYEHPHSVVALNVERRLAEEDVVIFCLIRAPENRSLAEMTAMVRHYQTAPVETLRAHQRAVALARVPLPFRRWAWWFALNVSGRLRCHNYGTFSVSSTAAAGAGLVTLLPILTSSVHYGLFDAQGRLDVRLTWDHRVLDGAAVARALADFEAILNRDMVQELTGQRRAAA